MNHLLYISCFVTFDAKNKKGVQWFFHGFHFFILSQSICKTIHLANYTLYLKYRKYGKGMSKEERV